MPQLWPTSGRRSVILPFPDRAYSVIYADDGVSRSMVYCYHVTGWKYALAGTTNWQSCRTSCLCRPDYSGAQCLSQRCWITIRPDSRSKWSAYPSPMQGHYKNHKCIQDEECLSFWFAERQCKKRACSRLSRCGLYCYCGTRPETHWVHPNIRFTPVTRQGPASSRNQDSADRVFGSAL